MPDQIVSGTSTQRRPGFTGPGIAVLMLLFSAIAARAQEPGRIDSLMTRRTVSCRDIFINSADLISSYIQAGKTDSAGMILTYWEQHCGNIRMIQRLKTLFGIGSAAFSETLYDSTILIDMAVYRSLLRNPSTSYYRADPDYNTAVGLFTTFTGSYAQGLIIGQEPGTLPYLIARHYGGSADSTFSDLQTGAYAGTHLRRYYDDAMSEIINSPVLYLALSAGVWAPAAPETQPFGSHPEIGFAAGSAGHEWDYSLRFFLRLGRSRDRYQYIYSGRTLTTDEFSGSGGLGLEAGRKLLFAPHHEIMAIGGISIDSYSPPQEGADPKKGINGIYFTGGVSYGFRPGFYGRQEISLQARYNQYCFSTSGSGLSGPLGSSFSLGLMVYTTISDHRGEYLDSWSYHEQ